MPWLPDYPQTNCMSWFDRFDSKWIPEPFSGCWLWTAWVNEKGVGYFRLGGRDLRAPRVAWQIANGPIPEGMFVCHHCDTPSCVNPQHLFLGTPRDNMHDMIRKGRQRHNARLSGSDVSEIRRSTDTWKVLAGKYNVSRDYVRKIKSMKARVV